jgi:hypothetical protein
MSIEANGHVSSHPPYAGAYLTPASATIELQVPGVDPDELTRLRGHLTH